MLMTTLSFFQGPNILVAKLATRRAKPNGQHYVSMEDIDTFILDKPVRDLPGKIFLIATSKLRI